MSLWLSSPTTVTPAARSFVVEALVARIVKDEGLLATESSSSLQKPYERQSGQSPSRSSWCWVTS